MKKFILVSLLMSTAAMAQGGSGVGNGGSGVVCYQKNSKGKKVIVKAYSLDLWEATHETNRLRVDLGSSQVHEHLKVETLISRVRRLDAEFASDLSQRFEKFKKSHEIQNRVAIKKIDDTKTLVDPKGDCERYQIAVQKKVVDPFFDKKFQFDLDVWLKMSTDERAGLIFHELLYWSEIERGVEDSLGVRRIVGILASQFGDTLSLQEYIGLIKKHLTRKSFRVGELQISLKPSDAILFDTDGRVSQGRVLNVIQKQQAGSRKGETYLYETVENQTYQFNATQEIIEGDLKLVEIDRISGDLQVRFLLSKHADRTLPSNPSNLQLAEFASKVLIKINAFRQAIAVSSQQARALIDSNDQFFALPASPEEVSTVTAGFQLTVSSAALTGFLISNQGLIEGVMLQVPSGTAGWLIDHSQPNGKHELSWKSSGTYFAKLDFKLKSLVSIR